MDSFSLSHVEKKGSISMNHVFQKGSILWVMLKKKVQFCGSEKCSIESPKKWVEFFASWKRRRRFNSFWVTKKGSILESYWKKNSILWVKLKKSSIHWVIFQTKFKSLSHSEKKEWFNSLSRIQNVQFFQSCSKKVFDSVNHMRKNNPLGHINQSKKFNPLGCVIKKFNY